MSKHEYKMVYVAISAQQAGYREFSLYRLHNGRRQQKKWQIGLETRCVRYDNCEWMVEMAGANTPDAAWFSCPVLTNWSNIDGEEIEEAAQDFQNMIDQQATIAGVNFTRLEVGERVAEPDIAFDLPPGNPDFHHMTPGRMDIAGRPPTFEHLQDLRDRMMIPPITNEIWQGIPGPQANVTATEEAARFREAFNEQRRRPQYPPRVFRAGHGLGRTRNVNVNEALDEWNRNFNPAMRPGVVDRAVEMARVDRAERGQATHRWEQDAQGNWVRHRINGG